MKKLITNAIILLFAGLTLLPFAFMLNNSFRTNPEIYRGFFGLPQSIRDGAQMAWLRMRGSEETFEVADATGETFVATPGEAARHHATIAVRGYRFAWQAVRPYMLNSLVVCGVTAGCILLLGSVTAYVLARYRFFGSQALFLFIISTMMFPGVLTLVPSFMLVRQLGLLNTYWAMILPYVAGGQVFAIFVFKSFFEGLPEELFESARIDGAGHVQMYRHIVLPLSKAIFSVVAIMNVISTWNNFLWPFITNTEGRYHVVASGLYVLATSPYAQNMSTLFAAYVIASVPLLVLFTYATKPFIQGLTSGAFKA